MLQIYVGRRTVVPNREKPPNKEYLVYRPLSFDDFFFLKLYALSKTEIHATTISRKNSLKEGTKMFSNMF